MIPQTTTQRLGALLNALMAIPALQRGNITNLWNRPIVHNPNGSYSTTESVSFRDDKGREVLVPTVWGGQHHSGSAAWQHYLQTGQHLGMFANPQLADKYATLLHIAQNYAQPPNYNRPIPWG